MKINENQLHFIHEMKTNGYDVIDVNLLHIKVYMKSTQKGLISSLLCYSPARAFCIAHNLECTAQVRVYRSAYYLS